MVQEEVLVINIKVPTGKVYGGGKRCAAESGIASTSGAGGFPVNGAGLTKIGKNVLHEILRGFGGPVVALAYRYRSSVSDAFASDTLGM